MISKVVSDKGEVLWINLQFKAVRGGSMGEETEGINGFCVLREFT